MRFKPDEAIQVLSRTPATLRAMLGGLDEVWTSSNYGKDTFSPFDVVGHLIHGERCDWMTRAGIILEHGTQRPFDPFDRYAMYQESKGKSMRQLLDEFAQVREANLDRFRALKLDEAQLDRTGMHPALGVVTLRQLLAAWTAHDLNHIHQIAKCMASQYRDESGPWAGYMGVYGSQS